MDAIKNLAIGTVATAPAPATTGTSLVLTSGHGARFPTAPFNATVWAAGALPDPTNAEIVRVTAVATNTLTIVRAQEGTTARTIVVGDQVALAITKRTFSEIVEHPVLDPTQCVGLGSGGGATALAYINAELQKIKAGGGGTIAAPAGNLTLAGAPIRLPSTVKLKGQGPGRSTITQSTTNVPTVVSENWVSASGASPAGSAALEDFTIVGASTGLLAHGVILRDFYSEIRRVLVYSGSGASCNGILVTDKDDTGNSIGGTLVENHYQDIQVFNSGGKGFYNDDASGAICTDAHISNVNICGSSAAAVGGLVLDTSAGWDVKGVHTYGSFTWAGLEMSRLFGTTINDIYIEPGWTHAGIAFYKVQSGSTANNLNVFATPTVANLPAVEMTKQAGGFSAGDGMAIGQLVVVNNAAFAINAVTWDDTASPVRGSILLKSGTSKGLITTAAGAGASAVAFAQVA